MFYSDSVPKECSVSLYLGGMATQTHQIDQKTNRTRMNLSSYFKKCNYGDFDLPVTVNQKNLIGASYQADFGGSISARSF